MVSERKEKGQRIVRKGSVKGREKVQRTLRKRVSEREGKG